MKHRAAELCSRNLSRHAPQTSYRGLIGLGWPCNAKVKSRSSQGRGKTQVKQDGQKLMAPGYFGFVLKRERALSERERERERERDGEREREMERERENELMGNLGFGAITSLWPRGS